MPLREYVCMNDHITERLVPRGEMDALMACPVCHGPAVRRAVARIVGHVATPNQEKLSTYIEASYEAEQAGLPRELWHAARVRAEAQQAQGAERWSPDRAWDPERID